MSKAAKIVDLREYKNRQLVVEKYSQFREMSAGISRALSDAKTFIEVHGLEKAKSNHRVQADLSQLCRNDLLVLKSQIEEICSDMQVIESVADVIPFLPRKAA